MKIFLLAALVFITLTGYSQATHDVLVGGGLDVIKTDNYKVFDKAQIGLEINYFVVRRFAVGGGVEIWTKNSNSFVMGMRWYANNNFFVRFRGLIGANDAAVGAGWSKPLSANMKLEILGDYFFQNEFALRGGISYLIR